MRNRFVFGFIFFYLFSLSAQAGTYAGYLIRTGSVDMEFDLSGVANPTTKPAINVVSGTLDQISYLCLNPAGNDAVPGSAAQRSIYGTDVLDTGNIVGKGQGVVTMSFEIPGPFSCVNSNWTYINNSAAAQSVTLTSQWLACTGSDTDPCFDGNVLTVASKPIATLRLVCGLSTVLRNADYSVVKGQTYSCVNTSQ